GRGRAGGAARLPSSAEFSPGCASPRAGSALLRRYHARLRRDVFVCRSRARGGPLGDRRLHSRIADLAARRGRCLAAGCASQGRGDAVNRWLTYRPTLRTLLAAGAGCVVVVAAGLIFAPSVALGSWLSADLTMLGLSLGALLILMIHDLTGGRWG